MAGSKAMNHRRRATGRLALLAPFAAVLAGCGDMPAANAPEAGARDHFSLHTEGGVVSAEVTPSVVSGDGVSFERFSEADGTFLRGSAFGKPIYLTIEPHRAVGIVGDQPFELRVEPVGDSLHFTGTERGKPADFWFGPREIRGRVASCGYELTRAGEAYQGSSACARPSRQTSVEVPRSLERWAPPELGAVLGIFLGAPHG
jgi:hypothetical protein